MKIQENYFYRLDNSKDVKVVWKKYDKACITGFGIVEINRLSGILITDEWLLKFGFKYSIALFWGNESRLTITKINNFYFIDLDKTTIGAFQFIHEIQNIFYALNNEELFLNNTPK